MSDTILIFTEELDGNQRHALLAFADRLSQHADNMNAPAAHEIEEFARGLAEE